MSHAASHRRAGLLAGGLLVAGVLLVAAPRPGAAAPAVVGSAPAARKARWGPALRAAAEVAKGRPDRALAALRGLRLQADSPALATAAAMCRLLAGDEVGAQKDLEQAARLGGAYLGAHYWRAVVALRRGQVTAARQALHIAQTLGGDRPRYLMLQVLIARKAGQAAAAQQALGRLARTRCDLLDPGLYPDPAVGLADALAHLLRDFPQPASSLLTAGNLLWATKRFRQAERYYEKAQRTLPDHPAVLLRLAHVALVAGDAPRALRLLTRGIAKNPEAAALYATRGEAYLLLGRTDEAYSDLARAVRGDPQEALPLARLADLLWDTGAYARAEVFYRYALARQAGLASARFGYAQALARRSQDALATASYRAATALNPANERYHLAYALHLEKLGRAADAAKARARAVAAKALMDRLLARLRRATREGGALRPVCRVARARALVAAQIMERKLAAPPAARAFLRAHLAQRAGRADPLALAQAAAGLRPERLLFTGAEPPTVITVKGQVERDVPVILQRFLMFVDPDRLR